MVTVWAHPECVHSHLVLSPFCLTLPWFFFRFPYESENILVSNEWKNIFCFPNKWENIFRFPNKFYDVYQLVGSGKSHKWTSFNCWNLVSLQCFWVAWNRPSAVTYTTECSTGDSGKIKRTFLSEGPFLKNSK